ncbi:hypothetical+protein [Methylocapsa aurea]
MILLMYFVIIAILGALAALMTVRDVAVIVAFLTLGLGFPIILAATAFVYGVCALPAVAGRRFGSGWEGVALSAGIMATVAIVPGYDAQRRAEEASIPFKRFDFAPPELIGVTSLEIRRRAADYDRTFMDTDACGYECRALLTYGRVEWVRVVMIDGAAAGSFYRLERGKSCAAPDGATSETATCVLPARDSGETPELTIQFDTLSLLPHDEPSPLRLVVPRTTKTVTAHWREGGEATEILHQTEVGVDVAVVPAIWGPIIDGMHSEGLDIMRRRIVIDRISFNGTLARLGLSLERPPGVASVETKPTSGQSINDLMTREALAVLNLPQTETFDPQQAKPIHDWLEHATNMKEWTPPSIDVLRRIAHDRRIRSPMSFDRIFEHNPVVTAALMPDMLQMIATDGIGPDHTAARRAAYTFPRLAPALLEPYADQIVALLDRGRAVQDILLPAVGRLGVDPTPYLLPFGADLDPRAIDRLARIKGACYADKRWASKLVGLLKEALSSNPHNERRRRKAFLSAIANLGDRDFVAQELSRESDEARLLSEINRYLTDKRYPPNSVCSTIGGD